MSESSILEPVGDLPVPEKVEPLPLGLVGGTIFDIQTIDRIRVKNVKSIAEKFNLSADVMDALKRVMEADNESCRQFLMSLNYGENKDFLNTIHRISALCDNESADELVNSGASPSYPESAEVAIHSYFYSNEIFEKLLQNKGRTQPFPERAYQIAKKRTPRLLVNSFNDISLQTFKKSLGELYQEKDCTSFVMITPIKNESSLGVMVEHSTRKSGYSVLDDSNNRFEPINPALRLRNTDFFFIDSVNEFLWINSSLLTGKTKTRLLMALGSLFYDDPSMFTTITDVSLETFNSPSLEAELRGVQISGIKNVELRSLAFTEHGLQRSPKTTIPGPFRKGCITDSENWDSKLPRSWKAHSLEIVYETTDGVRESITVTNKSIKTSCSPNFHLTLALLKGLDVIPNIDQ